MAEMAMSTPQEDMHISKVRAPWRRFWARDLDGSVYAVLWYAVLSFVFNVNFGKLSIAGSLLTLLIVSLMMLFVEPLFLSLFGATPGKWILGLRVMHYSGRKLTYEEALKRTWKVFVYGMGLRIPVFMQVRLFISFLNCDAQDYLPWEDGEGTVLVLKGTQWWRTVAYIAVTIMMFAITALELFAAQMPKNRGEITVAEFCENYNRLAKYHEMESEYRLDKDGNWKVPNDNSVTAQYVWIVSEELPQFYFTEENGKMTGLTFSCEMKGEDIWPKAYRREMYLATAAFVKAQPSCNMFELLTDVQGQMLNGLYSSFSYLRYGVRIDCEVEHDPDSYGFEFTMKKE